MSNEEHNTPDLNEDTQADVANSDDQVATEASSEVPADEAVSDVESLKAELEQTQQALNDAKEQALRAVAEGQNAKRRAEQDVEKARKFALEKFANELLSVADNMERALEAAQGDSEQIKALVEGVELTQKSLLSAFNKFSIEQLDPAGEPFDPQFHQAMSMVENPDVEPNTVIAVMQKGYTLSGRLLRPAMVMVSKAASQIDEKA